MGIFLLSLWLDGAIISEDFMRNLPWVSNLKLRASYGISGNFSIGNYEHIAMLKYNQYVLGTGEGSLVSGLRPSQISNDDLGWKKLGCTMLD